MNELNTVYDFIKSTFESYDVETITRVPFEDIGVIKNITFPLVNVDYTGCRYENGLVIFKFTIYSLKKRDLSKTPISNWWDNNDNRVANLVDTENILRKFIFKIENLNNDDDIELISRTDLTAGMAIFMDILDGHSFDVELGITNDVQC
jgi:hypothetical protein